MKMFYPFESRSKYIYILYRDLNEDMLQPELLHVVIFSQTWKYLYAFGDQTFFNEISVRSNENSDFVIKFNVDNFLNC